MHKRAAQVVQTLGDDPRVGEALRVVVAYGSTRNHLVYVREDLRDHITFEQLRPLLTDARQIHDSLQGQPTAGFDPGEPRVSVHIYEERVVLQVLGEQSPEGLLVVLDPDIDITYPTFINESLCDLTDIGPRS